MTKTGTMALSSGDMLVSRSSISCSHNSEIFFKYRKQTVKNAVKSNASTIRSGCGSLKQRRITVNRNMYFSITSQLSPNFQNLLAFLPHLPFSLLKIQSRFPSTFIPPKGQRLKSTLPLLSFCTSFG